MAGDGADSTPDPTRIKSIRGAYKGQITSLIKQAETFVLELKKSDTPSSEGLGLLDSLSHINASIKEKLALITNYDKQLFDITETDNIAAVIIEAEEYHEDIKLRLVHFTKFYERLSISVTPSLPASSSATPSTATPRNVHLPKLALATFSGDILQWQGFIDSFNAAVGNDKNLDKVQKYQYLNAQLSGEASRTIGGLSLTAENYDNAVKLLQERYGQKHKIIAAYMKALWGIPSPNGDLNSLRNFYDALENYIRGLNALGKDENSYGDLLVPILLEKLPSFTKRQIARDHGNSEWNLKDLRQSILKEIQAMEAGDTMDTFSNRFASMEIHSPATAAFVTDTNRGATPRTKKCVFCKAKDSHSSGECLKVTDTRKRLDIVKRDRLCFNCLGPHAARDCKSKFRCRQCKRKHHTSLCTGFDPQEKDTVKDVEAKVHAHSVTTDADNDSIPDPGQRSGNVLLKTAVTNVSNGSTTFQATILLDEGATRSFITRKLADKLQLRSNTSHVIHLAAFGDKESHARSLQEVSFSLHTKSNSKINISALVVPKIAAPLQNLINHRVLDLPHLRGLNFAHPQSNDETFEITILLGADYYWEIVQDQIIRGPGPTAVQSKLGYLLSGPINDRNSKRSTVLHVATCLSEEDTTLKRYWDLETIGIKDNPQTTQTPNDYQSYCSTHLSTDSDGRYTACLPWKPDHPPLPTNYAVAEKRTRSMTRRLSPELLNVYDFIIKDQLNREFIEKVEDDDVTNGHYLPHHPVSKDSDTTPIRIVYDCSCSTGDKPSLNNCLATGQPLLNDLASILLRFRLHKYALSADIEKAFLHVKLNELDRDYTKFFWLSDPTDANSPFDVYRFKVVLFGAACSPFILNATIRSHLEATGSDVAHDIKENIYVDNVLSGTESEAEAIAYFQKSTEILKTGGFNLRSWASNCKAVNEIAKNKKAASDTPTISTLGLKWDSIQDTLSYPAKKEDIKSDELVTKREVVRATASLYDPLGYIAPVHINAKTFIQEIWKEKLDWDEPLPTEMLKCWTSISKELEKATELCSVPRQLFPGSENHMCKTMPYELHVFGDSSIRAYGAAAYLRRGSQTALIMSKTRVAPTKTMTIPRLELMATLIAARLLHYVRQSLQNQISIKHSIVWSDSQIVLHWLNSQKKLPCFVENRVREIKSLDITEFRYCPTKDNPADLITRGMEANEYVNSKLWWHGPTWLGNGDWPVCELFDTALLIQSDEADQDDINHGRVRSELVPGQGDRNNVTTTTADISAIINPDNYSCYKKLLRVTAFVQRFVTNTNRKFEKREFGPLKGVEINNAELSWIRDLQTKSYTKEISDLKINDQKLGPLVRQLKLFLDKDGLVRVGGRLHNAPLKFETKFPILLPSKSRFTELLVREEHSKTLHSGVQTTVTSIRQRFWITRIRPLVKSILSKCVTCKRVNGKSYRKPIPAPLQKDRLLEAPAFTIVGIDFTGAVYLTDLTANNTPYEHKGYICLFTCAVTRAVHLELVLDLSTATFLRAFRRFAARRSLPHKLISDNGSTYLSAAEELKTLFNSPSVQSYLANRRVQWEFIPKRAPWFGGFYERLIGLTKQTLKKVLGRAYISSDEMQTLLAEIEATINDRPLTFLSEDVKDMLPLTPSHLVNGRNITTIPYLTLDENELRDPTFGYEREYQKRVNKLGKIMSHFWKRWSTEYLMTLREHDRISGKGVTENQISVGDIVLVEDSSRPRIKWNLAIVKDVKIGNDGLIRSASIKTRNGHTNRPISKLYPIETSARHYECVDSEKLVNNAKSETPLARPVRNSAKLARKRIRNWAVDLQTPYDSD